MKIICPKCKIPVRQENPIEGKPNLHCTACSTDWTKNQVIKITTANGLLYENGREIGLPAADNIARQFGHQYAEQLVKELETINKKI